MDRQPTLADVYAARKIIAPLLPRTPLIRSESLSEALGFNVYIKCENLQPIGAFKVRGGLNLVAGLSAAERAQGLVTASSGNHGQSIAYSARAFGIKATIFAPAQANPLKVAAMRRMGAEVILTGRDFDDANAAAIEHAARTGGRYVHAANEPALIAGVGTATLELIEDLPAVDCIFVPVGGGSGAAGCATVAKAINPGIKVIAVQAAGAPAIHDSWQAGKIISYPTTATIAEGLATRLAYDLTFAILRRLLDDFILVSDDEMFSAVRDLLTHAHQLAETSGAAPLAGAKKYGQKLAGKNVAMILSGGNVTLDTLRSIVGQGSAQ